MRIYKMTATFGKLECQTLTLEPGLNVITAPNEWGKSTWCAFLVAMLYGLDTRAKTTKTNLADKERYAPWSGSPMAGRIDLNWKGRDITIERRTGKRVPMGEFQAYETASGLPVPELTAANCGQMLLGVEQSVFRRAGFIRHADLPVTQDEALRRRLNALVTTGDESGAADRLSANLRDLRNRCRYNKTGLLPQTEGERDALQTKINELDALNVQCGKVRMQLDQMKDMLSQLENHRQTLAYEKAQADLKRVEAAGKQLEQAEGILRSREEACRDLPDQQTAQQGIRQLTAFREQWKDAMEEKERIPQEPEAPRMGMPFAGMDPMEAREMVQKDAKTYASVNKSKAPALLVVVGILGLVAAGALVFLRAYTFAAVAGAAALVALIWGIWEKGSMKKQSKALLEKYGSGNTKRWADPVSRYERELTVFQRQLQEHRENLAYVEKRIAELTRHREELCGDREPEAVLEEGKTILAAWDALREARRDQAQAKAHFEALSAMVKPVEKPARPDTLDHSEQETNRLLNECTLEQQRLQNRLGQYQGRMSNLGSRAELQKQLDQKKKRIAKLEETYAALTIAQDTLTEARAELQRRFAPRITRRAQKMLSAMTGGRYSSVTMSEDFSLRASAEQEETLRDAIWRSDGTMDQLYLALRLAVAEELTPKAPLVLDDVLVRFDDKRMTAAVELLRDMAEDRQILLFTCQGREAEI